jgi:hypothetical protein
MPKYSHKREKKSNLLEVNATERYRNASDRRNQKRVAL